MRCVQPFVTRQGAFGCGHCLPCRVQKRREWTHRILLEALDHGTQRCCFVTLTYSDDKVRNVNPRDLANWLKRFRKAVAPHKIRFFGCGEYGDRSFRPHYHAAVFGLGPCTGERRSVGMGGVPCECASCLIVRSTWGFGHVFVGQLSAKSAAYIAGYVTKKMTRFDDPRLQGRHPEFARMSNRPGIGAGAMWSVASEVLRYDLVSRDGDVPHVLKHGSKVLPLGRYLRRQLRKMVGLDEKTPEEALQKAANQLLILRAYAWQNSRSVASVFEELNSPYEQALTARLKAQQEARREAL